MSSDLQVVGVGLLQEGIEIAYVRLPQDLRKNGLMWQHTVLVPRGSDYDDEIETFEAALRDLLVDALDDENRAEPVEPIVPDDDEEDEEDR